MAYETIIVETPRPGRPGHAQPPAGAERAEPGVLVAELNEALDAFEADPAIGCIVITGSEKAFAAGADIKEMQTKTLSRDLPRRLLPAWDRIARIRKPIIAAVAGFALGGGCELAMMCDIVIAADNAQFGQPEIKLGVMPGVGGTQRLTRAVGKAKAMDLCLTGRMMGVAEAERAGLVARVVPADEAHGGGAEGGREDRRHVAADRDDGQGERQPGVRDAARRGHPLRAAPVPLDVRGRRPEGGNERLRRETEARFQAPLRPFGAVDGLRARHYGPPRIATAVR